jgi:hypothetical protein
MPGYHIRMVVICHTDIFDAKLHILISPALQVQNSALKKEKSPPTFSGSPRYLYCNPAK